MIYVLSGNRRETARWAEAQGHSLRQARHVYDAQTLPGRIAGVRLVQLPGFETRRDRHAIVARLKRANYRNIEIEIWKRHDDEFGGWYQVKDELVAEPGPTVTITPTTDEPPASHTELVNRVLPSGQVQATNETDTAEAVLTPEQLEAVTVKAHEVLEVVQPVDAPDPLEEFLGLTEKEAEGEVISPEAAKELEPAAPEQPKKRSRRTKEQMAYDAALADWESNGGSLEAVIEARDALAKRHPDDERLQTAPVSDEEAEQAAEDDDLDF